ncbi:MAG TPA: V-type ATPase subunit subunit G family protein [Methanoregula sp.]|nr:V-type ATPase subunit subunit G family protein [Methanoregula sp.]
MDPERTLLQQIRDKEQELAKEIETVRDEGEAMVSAARNEAEDLLCTAEKLAGTTAEQVYWKERGRTETEIETLKKMAELELETTLLQGERGTAAAAREIVRYVTGE